MKKGLPGSPTHSTTTQKEQEDVSNDGLHNATATKILQGYQKPKTAYNYFCSEKMKQSLGLKEISELWKTIKGTKECNKYRQLATENQIMCAEHNSKMVDDNQEEEGGEEIDIPVEVKRSKRKKKSRLIHIEGYSILKENNYDLEEGMLKTHSKNVTKKPSSKHSNKIQFDHEAHCMVCWDGGDLLLCDRCPGAYHKKCLSSRGLVMTGQSSRGNQFICPHHRCSVCGRGSSAAGGLIIACTECETSFCEEHEPSKRVLLDNKGCLRFQQLGQYHPRSMYYCRCSNTCQKFYTTRTTNSIDAAIKEQNTDEIFDNNNNNNTDNTNDNNNDNDNKNNSGSSSNSNGGNDGGTDDPDQNDLPNRPILPPSHSTQSLDPGTVVDYDGHRWYICRTLETPGQISWEYDVDPQMLLHQNQNIAGLRRNSQLIKRTPLLLGRGISKFVSAENAELIFAEIGNKLRLEEEKINIKTTMKERIKARKKVNKGTLWTRPKSQPLPPPYHWYHDLRDLEPTRHYKNKSNILTLNTLASVVIIDKHEKHEKKEESLLSIRQRQRQVLKEEKKKKENNHKTDDNDDDDDDDADADADSDKSMSVDVDSCFTTAPHYINHRLNVSKEKKEEREKREKNEIRQEGGGLSIGDRIFHLEKRVFGTITSIDLGHPTVTTEEISQEVPQEIPQEIVPIKPPTNTSTNNTIDLTSSSSSSSSNSNTIDLTKDNTNKKVPIVYDIHGYPILGKDNKDKEEEQKETTILPTTATPTPTPTPIPVPTTTTVITTTEYRKRRIAAKTDSGVVISFMSHTSYVSATDTFDVALSRETELDEFGLTLELHSYPFVPTALHPKENWHHKKKREGAKGPKGIFVNACDLSPPSHNHHFPESGRTILSKIASKYCSIIFINGLPVIPQTITRAHQMLTKGGRLWSTMVLQIFPSPPPPPPPPPVIVKPIKLVQEIKKLMYVPRSGLVPNGGSGNGNWQQNLVSELLGFGFDQNISEEAASKNSSIESAMEWIQTQHRAMRYTSSSSSSKTSSKTNFKGRDANGFPTGSGREPLRGSGTRSGIKSGSGGKRTVVKRNGQYVYIQAIERTEDGFPITSGYVDSASTSSSSSSSSALPSSSSSSSSTSKSLDLGFLRQQHQQQQQQQQQQQIQQSQQMFQQIQQMQQIQQIQQIQQMQQMQQPLSMQQKKIPMRGHTGNNLSQLQNQSKMPMMGQLQSKMDYYKQQTLQSQFSNGSEEIMRDLAIQQPQNQLQQQIQQIQQIQQVQPQHQQQQLQQQQLQQQQLQQQQLQQQQLQQQQHLQHSRMQQIQQPQQLQQLQHPFLGSRVVSNGCYGTVVGANLDAYNPLAYQFVIQRDDHTFENLTKTQCENGMAIVLQLSIQMSGIDITKFINPNYTMSLENIRKGWLNDGHNLIGYRVARNFTNKPSPCFGTIVAHRLVPTQISSDGEKEGWYFFNLHDDGDTEELPMLDVKVSIEMWVYYAKSQSTNVRSDGTFAS